MSAFAVWLLSIVGSILVILLIFLLVFHCLEDRIFLQATGGRAIAENEPQDGQVLFNCDKSDTIVEITNVSTVTADAVTLRGYHLKYQGPLAGQRRRLIQYMHGTRVFLPHKSRFLARLSQNLRADIVAFAYRGFSRSDRVAPTVEGLTRDFSAITSFVANLHAYQGGPSKVETILYGKSFGCAASLVAHSQRPNLHEQIILESPFTRVRAVYLAYLPRPLGHLIACASNNSWCNDEMIGGVGVPTIFLAGTLDTLTPITMARQLHQMAHACPRKELYEVQGGGHNRLYVADDRFFARINDFLLK